MTEKQKRRRNDAKSEFFEIVQTHIIPLLDIKGNVQLVDEPYDNKWFIQKEKNTNDVRIFPLVSRENIPSPFYVKVKLNDGCDVPKFLYRILVELLKVSEYNYYDFSIKRYYGKDGARQSSYKKRALNLAYELGICEWLTQSEKDAVVLHTVITQIINWSCRTYEGKKVPFGIVINFNENANNNNADYLKFLNNDSSAVFTDGIFSGILLDKKGRVLSFLTRNSITCDTVNEKKQIFVPYQFEDIAKHCSGSAVGVIALKNGEIILIKDQAIVFAKRGNKWINFNWRRVYHSLRPYFQKELSLAEDDIYVRIQELYCTMLDVSFAHSGGCIAIIIPDKEKSDDVKKIIKERIDLCSKGEFPKGISAESKEKMTIMSYLLSYKTSEMQSFFNIERVLRKEIIGLDGATVISLNGSFYCAGSIVAVTSGNSSGGGRTAAAKKLSILGVGIKISEDGYIEAFGLNLDDTTERIVRLFDFK